jgi:hypothetical protein
VQVGSKPRVRRGWYWFNFVARRVVRLIISVFILVSATFVMERLISSGRTNKSGLSTPVLRFVRDQAGRDPTEERERLDVAGGSRPPGQGVRWSV